ncbi:MAG TPA: hypothetical protein GX707_05145 [Epulopiscium sp.]|nr:hypothetical protein [Candidatus Epulonipiscium sp.]
MKGRKIAVFSMLILISITMILTQALESKEAKQVEVNEQEIQQQAKLLGVPESITHKIYDMITNTDTSMNYRRTGPVIVQDTKSPLLFTELSSPKWDYNDGMAFRIWRSNPTAEDNYKNSRTYIDLICWETTLYGDSRHEVNSSLAVTFNGTLEYDPYTRLLKNANQAVLGDRAPFEMGNITLTQSLPEEDEEVAFTKAYIKTSNLISKNNKTITTNINSLGSQSLLNENQLKGEVPFYDLSNDIKQLKSFEMKVPHKTSIGLIKKENIDENFSDNMLGGHGISIVSRFEDPKDDKGVPLKVAWEFDIYDGVTDKYYSSENSKEILTEAQTNPTKKDGFENQAKALGVPTSIISEVHNILKDTNSDIDYSKTGPVQLTDEESVLIGNSIDRWAYRVWKSDVLDDSKVYIDLLCWNTYTYPFNQSHAESKITMTFNGTLEYDLDTEILKNANSKGLGHDVPFEMREIAMTHNIGAEKIDMTTMVDLAEYNPEKHDKPEVLLMTFPIDYSRNDDGDKSVFNLDLSLARPLVSGADKDFIRIDSRFASEDLTTATGILDAQWRFKIYDRATEEYCLDGEEIAQRITLTLGSER